MVKQHIRIRSLDDALGSFRKTWEALEGGKTVRRQGGTYFTSLEAARKILTPKRLELLRAIRQKSPRSIYHLARLVGRDVKNVQGDVRALSELGLISLKRIRGTAGRPVTIPRVKYSEIEFRIAV